MTFGGAEGGASSRRGTISVHELTDANRELAERIRTVAENVEKRFKTSQRVLSFAEYLELFAIDPVHAPVP